MNQQKKHEISCESKWKTYLRVMNEAVTRPRIWWQLSCTRYLQTLYNRLQKNNNHEIAKKSEAKLGVKVK